MKTAKDPRHQLRRDAVKILFAETFLKQEQSSTLASTVMKQKVKLDKKIHKAAPAWPVEKLNKVDLATLRLAVYELDNTDTPPKVIIDEAVELAKEYGSENSPSFVNGVLGTILKNKQGSKDKGSKK
jgi:N utilization substance protein B